MDREYFIIDKSDLQAIAELFLRQGFAVKAEPYGPTKDNRCRFYFWRDDDSAFARKIIELKSENEKLREMVKQLRNTRPEGTGKKDFDAMLQKTFDIAFGEEEEE